MRKIRPLILASLLIALGLCVSGGVAKPGTPAGTTGPYKLIFAGGYVGEGQAVVTGGMNKISMINGNVTEVSTGATGTFKANNLALDDGRFVGTCTILGQPATLCGRVEAADGQYVLFSRIFCSFTNNTTGDSGRFVGKK